MSIGVETISDVAVVRPVGRVDTHTLAALSSWIDRAPSCVVVDLGAVTFLDSAALAVLVRGMKRCRQQGGDLRLCAPSASVRMIFELTRLDRAFEIFPAEADALRAFSAQSSDDE
jgi:anti-sigma B factor antagonist